MIDTIIDLTDCDHDDIAMRIQRVNGYLIDRDLEQPSGGDFLPDDDQYLRDVEVLVDWVNTPDLES